MLFIPSFFDNLAEIMEIDRIKECPMGGVEEMERCIWVMRFPVLLVFLDFRNESMVFFFVDVLTIFKI